MLRNIVESGLNMIPSNTVFYSYFPEAKLEFFAPERLITK